MLSDDRPVPTLAELFVGFASVSSLAFGGVLPWARFVVVEKRGWLSDEDFVDTLALCQLLPGPNIANMAVAIGARFRGAPGAVVSMGGLMGLPVVVVLVLATVYAEFATLPAVRGALAGMAAAAAGLIGGMALRLGEPILRRRFAMAAPVIGLVFVAVALLRLPLWPVILSMAPLAVLLAWRLR